jgi:hypothetical protein
MITKLARDLEPGDVIVSWLESHAEVIAVTEDEGDIVVGFAAERGKPHERLARFDADELVEGEDDFGAGRSFTQLQRLRRNHASSGGIGARPPHPPTTSAGWWRVSRRAGRPSCDTFVVAGHVFVSYSRMDQHHVDRLVELLRRRGAKV